MKKTIAALGASVLGLGSAVVAGAVPATAAPILPDCENIQEQIGFISSPTPDPEAIWFENCIPQYGLGKAEFTIVPSETDPAAEFPEGFEPLDGFDEEGTGITVSTTLDQARLTEYFDGTDAPFDLIPILPVDEYEISPTEHTYEATVFAPIESLDPIAADTTPAAIIEACEFGDAEFYGWRASYGAIDSTFSQTVDGKVWDYTIEAQSPDGYFLITDNGSEPWLCVTDGDTVAFGPLNSSGFIFLGLVMPFLPQSLGGSPTAFEQFAGSSTSVEQLWSDVDSAAIGESGLYTLGIFGPDGAAPAPAPALAATGSDGNSLILPAIIVGGIVVLGGALVAVSVIRKRRKDEPATTLDTPDPTV